MTGVSFAASRSTIQSHMSGTSVALWFVQVWNPSSKITSSPSEPSAICVASATETSSSRAPWITRYGQPIRSVRPSSEHRSARYERASDSDGSMRSSRTFSCVETGQYR